VDQANREILRFLPELVEGQPEEPEDPEELEEWKGLELAYPLPGTPAHQAKMEILHFFPELMLHDLEELDHLRFAQHLNQEAVSELKTKFHQCGLMEDAAAFLAEHLPCQYLADLDRARARLRPAVIKKHLEAIQEAACNLQRVLKIASREASEVLDLLEDTVRDEYADILPIDDSPLRVTQEMFPRDPKTLFALGDFADAAKTVLGQLPADSGSKVAGAHDETGASARKRLTVRIRCGLRNCGLPAGSQADGPVAGILHLIHQVIAGSGDKPPTWPKRFAENAPGWEREASARKEEEWDSYEAWVMDPAGTYQARRNRRLGKYEQETKGR